MKNKLPKRLENVLEKDRLLISLDSSSLIIYDLKKLLDNYFNISGEIDIKISPESGFYSVNITTKAVGIKTFSTLK